MQNSASSKKLLSYAFAKESLKASFEVVYGFLRLEGTGKVPA
jgi:hypothetical protein